MNRSFPLLLSSALLSAGCLPQLEPVQTSKYGDYQCDTNLQEVGDDLVDADVLRPPVTLCGDLDSTGNNGDSYTGDRDNTLFRVSTLGTYNVTLEWDEPSGDYDIYLYDDFSVVRPEELALSSSEGYPEQFTVTLQPNKDYLLVVVGWSGNAGPWGVTIQPGQ